MNQCYKYFTVVAIIMIQSEFPIMVIFVKENVTIASPVASVNIELF